MYRRYDIRVWLNGIYFTELLIDPHYEEKHMSSINDELIIKLVEKINFRSVESNIKKSTGYTFYELDVIYSEKLYRLILTMPYDHSFLGVRNAYRRLK